MRDESFTGRMHAERRFLASLVGGFGIVILLMLTSGFLLLRAIRTVGEGAEKLSDRQLVQTELIDRLQRIQAAVGDLLYRIAEDASRSGLLRHRTETVRLRGEILTLADDANGRPGLPAEETAAWSAVKQSAVELLDPIGAGLQGKKGTTQAISAAHRRFVAAVVQLTEASYHDAQIDQSEELRRDADRFTDSARLLGVAVTLALAGAVASIVFALKMFGGIERQADTLRSLSLHILDEQETLARRFSQELHDEFGQTLNAIESTLSVIRASDAAGQARVEDAKAMVKESIANAREMSRLLRPAILDDFGLDAGLRQLAAGFSQRTGIVVDHESAFRGRLPGEVETHLFRIAQEALTNVAKHSTARNVRIELMPAAGSLTLRIRDNGGGMAAGPASGGLGLIGMKERARAVGGSARIRSVKGEGVEILITVPQEGKQG